MKAVVITGPTASGKTAVSLEVAGDVFEVVSADSVQVYKGLDIGSGKLPPGERRGVRHHLIDIVEPDYPFTAGEYCRRAGYVCNDINERGKLPLFAGGTGLYIDSFFKGISEIPAVDAGIRSFLQHELEEKGSVVLYEELKNVDPEFAEKVHFNDSQRILRGLEVYKSTGFPVSSFFPPKGGVESEDTVYVGVYLERTVLVERINARVDKMLEEGFTDEVKLLRESGYNTGNKSMRTIGYFELNRFFDGELDFEEAVELIKRNTVKYAKRQMTWFNKNKKITWFDGRDIEAVKKHIFSHGFYSL